MTVRDELQARALFEQRYGIAAAPLLLREIERRVIGGDWGANGYTTTAQAGQLASGLGLSAADRLLDLGTGRGWPGLYLAARSGCRAVLADLPLEGLRVAAARAQAEGLAARASVVAAAASALPFHARSFDRPGPTGAPRRLRAAASRAAGHVGRHRRRVAAPRLAACPTRMSPGLTGTREEGGADAAPTVAVA